jgi:hypothetical protein
MKKNAVYKREDATRETTLKMYASSSSCHQFI